MKRVKITSLIGFFFLIVTSSHAQYESGGFGGFHFQLMNFGSGGTGIAYGGMGGAVFAGNGFIGGFGYGGSATRRNSTVAIGYGGIMGGAQLEIDARQKLAPGVRLGFGGYANVLSDDNGNKFTTNGNMMRLEPNLLYNLEAFPKFNVQVQVGYSFNIIGNLSSYNTAYLSVGFVLGTF